jgi:hypothetical protein
VPLVGLRGHGVDALCWRVLLGKFCARGNGEGRGSGDLAS